MFSLNILESTMIKLLSKWNLNTSENKAKIKAMPFDNGYDLHMFTILETIDMESRETLPFSQQHFDQLFSIPTSHINSIANILMKLQEGSALNETTLSNVFKYVKYADSFAKKFEDTFLVSEQEFNSYITEINSSKKKIVTVLLCASRLFANNPQKRSQAILSPLLPYLDLEQGTLVKSQFKN